MHPGRPLIIIVTILFLSCSLHSGTDPEKAFVEWGKENATAILSLELSDEISDLEAIGMAYGGGQFWNSWKEPAERFVDSIPAYDPNGIEQILSAVGPDRFFILWDQAPGDSGRWLQEPITQSEDDNSIVLEPGEWNACIYLDLVHPGTPHH